MLVSLTMKKQIQQMHEFNKAFNDYEQETPNINIPEKYKELRKKLLREEVEEVAKAIDTNDLPNLGQELGDLLYVLVGTATTFGLAHKLESIFDEIHRSNMSKLGPEGRPVVDEKGKAIKSENYKKADIRKVLESNAEPEETFEDIHQKILTYVKSRGWFPLQPEDLAKSIMLESAELLEHFQWDVMDRDSGKDVMGKKKWDEISSELADVMIYCVQFAENTGINLIKAMSKKLDKLEEKYPVEAFQNGHNSEFYRSQKAKYRVGK